MTTNFTYGVFVWKADGIYKQADALKVYKTEKGAEKHADKLNDDNPVHVVRVIYS
jgi:hypothetical protein